MNKFDFNDSVTAKEGCPDHFRPGALGSVVAMRENRKGEEYYDENIPEGWYYYIEFNDGSDVEVAETDLVMIISAADFDKKQ